MTTSAVAKQSILSSPVSPMGLRSRSDLVLTSTYLPRQNRKASMQVIRCMAKESPVSTKFEDVLAFSGPAPERINGRLAMVGFVAALGVELAKGDDVVGQLVKGGLPWFLGTTMLLSVASLIPLFKGVISVQSKSDGLMTSDAELWNGRFAMIGLVALVFTEYVKGGALV